MWPRLWGGLKHKRSSQSAPSYVTIDSCGQAGMSRRRIELVTSVRLSRCSFAGDRAPLRAIVKSHPYWLRYSSAVSFRRRVLGWRRIQVF